MLNSINIKSFKSFIDLTISLNKLTILTGLNNSGKSSIIQAIRMCLLCKDNLSPYIPGHGDFSELKSKLSSLHSKIDISLKEKNESNSNGMLNVKLEEDTTLCDCSIEAISYDYISADRHGPSVILPTMNNDISNITIGAKGEYFVDYFLKFENVIIPELIRHDNSIGNTLKHQVSYWMSEISPGVELNFEVNKNHDISHLEVNTFRATNTGFGISYSLPIVLSALTMSSLPPLDEFKYSKLKKWHSCPNKLLIIENPEAHLHPKGQTALGKLIALASACGVQVIIETHSDHFVDGIRLAVKQYDELCAQDCSIHYLTREKGMASVSEEIKINEDGKLSSWPAGFFDQTSINLSKLAKRDKK